MARTRAPLARKLDSIGWGVFFIWMGIAFLADVGWGVGLLGAGVISLGVQAARLYLGLPFEWFGLTFGIVFIAWGLVELLNVQLGESSIPSGAFPIVLIVVGITLVALALKRKR